VTRKILISVALLGCLGLVAIWGSQLDWSIVARGDNDFAMIYTGAKLARSPALYSFDDFQTIQRQVANVHGEHVLFARLPYYALLLKPLSLLPYRTAYVLFTVVNLAALGLFLFWFAERTPLKLVKNGEWQAAYWLAGVISVPVLTAFAVGQDILLPVAICGAAVMLVRRDTRFLAGAVLSLCTIKPHLFLMLPVLLIARKEWRILAGGACGGAVLFLLSVIAQGWTWPAAYVNLLKQSEDVTAYVLPNLRGLLMATVGENLGIELVLAATVTVLTFIAARKAAGFEPAFAAALIGGLLVSHHAYIQDCCLLLAAVALAKSSPALRWGALILLTPPFYFLLGAGILGAILPLGLLGLSASALVSESR
jgi:hypothetical protein